MTRKQDPVIKDYSGKSSFTEVSFKPDPKLFNMSRLDDDIVAVMAKYVYDLACVLGSSVRVKLNG